MGPALALRFFVAAVPDMSPTGAVTLILA